MHMHMIVHAFFPALLMLRLADSNCANMDKSYFYVQKLNQSLETSKQLLDSLPKETEYMKLTSNVRKDDWSVEEEESDGLDNNKAINVEEVAAYQEQSLMLLKNVVELGYIFVAPTKACTRSFSYSNTQGPKPASDKCTTLSSNTTN